MVKPSGGVCTFFRGVLLILVMLVWAGGARSDKVDELWQGGATSALPRNQLDRALWLYELGARDKADDLLASWVAVMPEAADLPDGFADLPADPDLLVAILLQHLQRGNRKALPVLQYWLDQDRMVGWRVFAALSDGYRAEPGQPMFSNLALGPGIATRLPQARQENRAARGK
ncbi:MAG: hypothetical protein H7245_23355 [Candidatus Saccharibacteria bacterium]|nr:hypothetical protein [Pseudorhodobacter sp.]